jgi:choline dehydrogenase
MSMAPSQLGAFALGPCAGAPDLEYHVQPLSLPKFGDPLHAFDAITAACATCGTSRGSVRAFGRRRGGAGDRA